MKDYSQNGESLVIKEIFDKIKPVNKFMVEFGASDGYWLSNIRMFMEMGWNGLQFEGIGNPLNGVKKEFITKENINEIFKKYEVPKEFDVLSIDIDGNDYWVWETLEYEPSVVVIEYNSNFSIDQSYVLNYNVNHSFKTNNSYSASFTAMKKLGEKKGYFLYTESKFINMIFIKNKYKNYFKEFDESTLKLPEKQHKGIKIGDYIKI